MKDEKDGRRGYSWAGWWVGGFFTLLILGFTLIIWWAEKSGGSCAQKGQSQNSKSPDASNSLSGDTPTLISKDAPPQETDKSTTNPESYFCRLIAPTNLPDDYLAIVGMGGVFIAVFSLSAIRRQNRSIHHQAIQVRKQTGILETSAKATEVAAEAARDNAKTALLSTEALINSERAWVDADLIDFGGNTYKLAIENLGKTPAQINNCLFAFVAVPITDSPFSVTYADAFVANAKPLLTTGRKFLLADDPFDMAQHFGSDWEQITARKKHGWVRVTVKYFDVITKTIWRETEIVYWFNPVKCVLESFPPANRYT